MCPPADRIPRPCDQLGTADRKGDWITLLGLWSAVFSSGRRQHLFILFFNLRLRRMAVMVAGARRRRTG